MMFIPPTIKALEQCTGLNARNDWRGHVFLQDDCLLATNGTILAVVPIALSDDEPGNLVLPVGIKPGDYQYQPASGQDRERLTDQAGNSTVLPAIEPPSPHLDWRRVQPQDTPEQEMLTLSVDVDLLVKLAKAVCAPRKDKALTVTLTFEPGDYGNVQITPAYPITDGAIGILSKVKISRPDVKS